MVSSLSRRVVLTVICLGFFVGIANADPLVVTPLDPGMTNLQLALFVRNALFNDGSGVQITGVTYNGAAAATGNFSGGADVIGLASGILLTSGSVNTVVGPNNSGAAGVDNGATGYTPLSNLLPPPSNVTFDASVLQITLIPDGQSLQFTYVFGSEEYNEYVGSQYNDVFAFFVNGTAAQNNYAVIPGTNAPVSINTVNLNSNSSFFFNNTGSQRNTQLDGFTTVMSFLAPVTPGVPNTLTLAIADTSDHVYDSAVFLLGGNSPGGNPSNPVIPAKIDENGNFEFNFFVVDPAKTVWIDPIVAIGYDFIVNSGPNVQSITLPNIGDGLFDIFDGAMNLLAHNWMHGIPYMFGSGGVSAFSIRGIETSAMLDPTNPLAFVVGMTFASAGLADINMNPATQLVGDPVPEPGSLSLMLVGLATAMGRRYFHRRRV